MKARSGSLDRPRTGGALAATLLLAALLLAACSQQATTDYHTGTDGLTLTFSANSPSQVYEGSSQPFIVRLSNLGAYDLNYSVINFTLKGDGFYVNVSQDPTLSNGQDLNNAANVFESLFPDALPSQLPLDTNTLHGKGPGYEQGDWLDLTPIVDFKPIMGTREQPTTQLFASVCYPYQTFLGTAVCVDANAFNGNVQRQVCSAQTLTFPNGQGAPVAVSMVENRPSPVRVSAEGGRGYLDVTQPVFVIHVKNVGDGTILPLPESETDAAKACSLQAPAGTPVGVRINATLSTLQLDCNPNPVLVRDGEGFTTCVLPASSRQQLYTPNYLATFTVELAYLYRTAITKDVTIVRTSSALNASDYTFPERDQNPGFIDGQTRCEYCSQNHDAAGCDGWPSKANATAQFSCSCGEQECLQKVANGNCVYGQSWCPGTNYCCVPGR